MVIFTLMLGKIETEVKIKYRIGKHTVLSLQCTTIPYDKETQHVHVCIWLIVV